MIQDFRLEKSITIMPSTTQIDKAYCNSSVLLLTSRYEGLPMVLLEAMSHGLPVVAYTCKCGPKDLIEDGVNGLLVQEGNIEEFATKTIGLLNNTSKINQMGANAFKMAADYSKENIMHRWIELFNTLIESNKK